MVSDENSTTLPQRRRIRLPHYDYSSQGAYFLTICTHGKRCLFGEVVGDQVKLNRYGQIAEECWQEIPAHFPKVELDWHIVMPNHVHGVLMLFSDSAATACRGPTSEGLGRPVSGSVSTVVRSYKSAVTKRLNELFQGLRKPYWQPKYYDHIIRNEDDLREIRRYIEENPLKWAMDRENPDRKT